MRAISKRLWRKKEENGDFFYYLIGSHDVISALQSFQNDINGRHAWKRISLMIIELPEWIHFLIC